MDDKKNATEEYNITFIVSIQVWNSKKKSIQEIFNVFLRQAGSGGGDVQVRILVTIKKAIYEESFEKPL